MIPLYGCQAVGGKIYQLDDPTVVKDGADSTGAGGTAVVPYMVSTPLGLQFDMGYNKLRRFLQRVGHSGTCVLRMTGIRDGQPSGQPVTRSLGISDVGIVNAPMNDAASDFQLKIEITSYSADVSLGNSEAWAVMKRRFR